MNIIDFDISELSIELKKPFITSLRRVDAINDIIIRILTDSEFYGYGEACAVTAITGKTNEDIIKDLKKTIFPLLKNKELNTQLLKTINSLDVSSEAKACIDMAIYDLLAKESNQSLFSYLGAKTSSLQTDLTISVNEASIMAEDAVEAISQGFRVLKVKLDSDIEKNILRLNNINNIIPASTKLRLDPNQALTLDTCLQMLSAVRTDNIECIEQPFSSTDIKSMKFLKDKNIVPVLADESLFNSADARQLLASNSIDMSNIKLMKCGGIYEAINIAKVAKEYKTECMIGSMLEGPISLLAAAHFGLSQDNVTMADLDSPLYLKEHPLLKPFNLEKDKINLDNELGLGIDNIIYSLEYLFEKQFLL